MFLHWGPENRNGGGGGGKSHTVGSEHAINDHFFAAEIQLYGFNADLFHNLSEGMMQPYGAVGVAIMVQESDRASNRGIKTIMSHLKKVCLFRRRFYMRYFISPLLCFYIFRILV